MNELWSRSLEHIHGHVGWLAVAALAHPAILLRQPRRRALFAAASATALVSLTGALGAVIYPGYRSSIKPLLFAQEPAIGWAFERKEHLAVGAIALAWAGLAAHVGESRQRPGKTGRLERAAYVAYVGAAAMALIAAMLGLVVSTHRTF